MTAAAIDIHQIIKRLPHRYPILLVDRVLEVEGSTRIKRPGNNERLKTSSGSIDCRRVAGRAGTKNNNILKRFRHIPHRSYKTDTRAILPD